ncbi:hypothetical protein MFU01_07390 [Myxococcus fulvus]|uniref:Uncharacterized protein n=1 Tax=Myxococcus fulvus TaxID=33 RepID=A0A511SW70_MYXFU|nr:hypothetical protein MFU01_07390 [Myxococcus fulvus]
MAPGAEGREGSTKVSVQEGPNGSASPLVGARDSGRAKASNRFTFRVTRTSWNAIAGMGSIPDMLAVGAANEMGGIEVGTDVFEEAWSGQ